MPLITDKLELELKHTRLYPIKRKLKNNAP